MEGIPKEGNEEELGGVRLTRPDSWEGHSSRETPAAHKPVAKRSTGLYRAMNGSQLLPELNAFKAFHSMVPTSSPITPALLLT